MTNMMSADWECEGTIAHAVGARAVPIVVAINKCDKPEASPDRVRTELAKAGLSLEAFGGDVQCIEVSALKVRHAC